MNLIEKTSQWAYGIALLVILVQGMVLPQVAQAEDPEIKELREAVRKLSERSEAQEEEIKQLRRELNEGGAHNTGGKAEAALDQAVAELESSQSSSSEQSTKDMWSTRMGGTTVRLVDVSLDALIGAGWSTENDETLETLQGGGHDPNRRGFTVQNIELSLTGAIDSYFTGETHLIYFIDRDGESQFELEEAFLTTQSLPYDLQLEFGQSFTEYGLVNPAHPHAWDWMDQPLINTRLFGADGMRGAGFRVGWLTPLPWFSELHFGMQNANGETMVSFLGEEGEGIGGRPTIDRGVDSLNDLVYLVRMENSWDLADTVTMKWGVSGLYGPNATGRIAETWIYGSDLKIKWRPVSNYRGWPFVLWQSEYSRRDYNAQEITAIEGAEVDADSETIELVSFTSDTLRDNGFYSQLLWGFKYGWAIGGRFEYVTGSGDSVGGRANDPFRSDRHRFSPIIAWYPSEYSRIRMQYNYDDAEYLDDGDAHSYWLGFEWLYGAHPAHKY